MPAQSLLDPLIIAQLGNLHVRARRILDGLYSGHHINRNRGQSNEFSQHRSYNMGDDLKRLDWKILGRTDRLMVKQYDEETNIFGTIVLDNSKSMGFSSGGRVSKLEYAKTLAAALGYLLVFQHDAVGLLSPGASLPPSGSRGRLETYFQILEGVQPSGVWDYRALVEKIQPSLKRKGLVIIFTDLLSDSESLISTFRALHARKNEVMVFHIMDPTERDLDLQGHVLFEDSETGEELRTEPHVIQSSYQTLIKNRIASFSYAFGGTGMDYQVLTTDTPFDKGMGHYLSWRGTFS